LGDAIARSQPDDFSRNNNSSLQKQPLVTVDPATSADWRIEFRLPAVQLQRPFSGEQLAPFLQAHFCAQSSPKVFSGHSSPQSSPRYPAAQMQVPLTGEHCALFLQSQRFWQPLPYV
jgi:hypothetical protein